MKSILKRYHYYLYSTRGSAGVIRGPGHNNLPNFIGQYFPPRDDPDQYPFYCASMLMLLRPWRNIEMDLKKATQSWEAAFEEFLETAPANTKDILSGIQYYHQCRSSAIQQAQETGGNDNGVLGPMDELEGTNENSKPFRGQPVLTEEELQALQASHENTMEDVHAFMAI